MSEQPPTQHRRRVACPRHMHAPSTCTMPAFFQGWSNAPIHFCACLFSPSPSKSDWLCAGCSCTPTRASALPTSPPSIRTRGSSAMETRHSHLSSERGTVPTCSRICPEAVRGARRTKRSQPRSGSLRRLLATWWPLACCGFSFLRLPFPQSGPLASLSPSTCGAAIK